MNVQCSANYINCFGFRDFLNDSVRRAFRRHTTHELSNGMQTRETPIYTLYMTLGLHTHTEGLKGWGCLGPQLLRPQLTVLLAAKTVLLKCTASRLRCLTKSNFLDFHMQGKINVKIKIKQRDKLNKTIKEKGD